MSLAHDTMLMRRMFVDANKRRGLRFVVRRRMKPADFKAGLVEHCHVCWDDVYKNAQRESCAYCFGTAFNGGYFPPVLAWGDPAWAAADDVQKAGLGVFSTQNATVSLSHEVLLSDLDLLWLIYDYELDGSVKTVGSLYEIAGAVTRKTAKGDMLGSSEGETASLMDILIYQTASMVRVPDESIKQTVPWK